MIKRNNIVVPYLPALQQEAAVHSSKPHDSVPCLEVFKPVALGVQVDAQALEQLRGGRLDHRLLGGRVLSLCLKIGQQHRLGCQLVAMVAVVVVVVGVMILAFSLLLLILLWLELAAAVTPLFSLFLALLSCS
ncbi:hypothetical protein C0J52_00995 [Blattella germanica]|nr:hypothetical protein C0J52_00995 [Blattella germanica]